MNKKILGILILSLAAVTTANASQRFHFESRPYSTPAAAPEIDPASAVSAFTLLAGGLAVIRGRRANRK